MRAYSKLRPGQRGTKKWVQQYGSQLLCVRYRYDIASHRRYTTVELIVAEGPWIPPRIAANTIVRLHLRPDEHELAGRLSKSGAQWNSEEHVWEVQYQVVVNLGLVDRLTNIPES